MLGFLSNVIPILIPKLIGIVKAANRLGVSPRHIYDMIKNKEIDSTKIGGRRKLFEKDLNKIVKINRIKTETEKSIVENSFSLGLIVFRISLTNKRFLVELRWKKVNS